MARKNRQPETPPDHQEPEPLKTAPELPGSKKKTAPPQTAEALIEEMGSASSEQKEGEVKSETRRSPGDKTADVDDAVTGKAVDEIAAEEADTMLALQDELGREQDQPRQPNRLVRILKSKRTWAIVLLIILVLFAVPATRYKLLGLFIKKQATILVTDSKTHTPVSAASIRLHGAVAKTNAEGRASFKVAVGPSKLVVSKQYYKTYTRPVFIGMKAGSTGEVRLEATGRQVPIRVLNRFTAQPIANAEIKVLKTSAKTDKQGRAVIVLPATLSTAKGAVDGTGYNMMKIDIQVTNDAIPGNNFSLTPGGHVYFLSNTAGTINVTKTNLDGSGSQTVLEGTGKEDGTSTALLASRDWRYLALKSRRDTAQPVLYLIDTKDDKVTQFDSNNGTFNPIGWHGHNFMYDFVSATVPQSQKGHETIRSYDADQQQLNQLDQNQVDNSAYQDFSNFYVLNSQLVYNTRWHSNGGRLDGKNASIRGVQPDGRNKKDYQTFTSAGLNYIRAALYQPQAIYYDAYNSAAGATTYYNFANQTVNTTTLDASYFKKTYPTYLLSPSGNKTFWSDQQAGEDELFIGDSTAHNAKRLNRLTGFKPYGWYTDDYILLSKADTDLYIAPASGPKANNRPPARIGYYYKPVETFPSYGYGYGGQ